MAKTAVTCPRCRGSGKIRISKPDQSDRIIDCPRCNGDGSIIITG